MPRLLNGLLVALLAALLLAAAPALAKHHHHHHHDDADAGASGLANVTLLVVRHAEKPSDDGDRGLSPAGEARAKAYATYFRHFAVDGQPLAIDTLIASADSKESARPRLTLEPLSKATGIAIQTPFANKQVKDAAAWIAAGQTHKAALIAWHHGKLAKLIEKLGADPASVLPDGQWPEDVYDWVIVLRYDGDGNLSEAKRIVEPADVK